MEWSGGGVGSVSVDNESGMMMKVRGESCILCIKIMRVRVRAILYIT